MTAKTRDGDVDGLEEQEALEAKIMELEGTWTSWLRVILSHYQPVDKMRLEQEALTAERETVAQLQERLEHLEDGQAGGDGETSETLIPRPKGTAGTHWSIQEAMGLAGSEKKHGIYKGLVVSSTPSSRLMIRDALLLPASDPRLDSQCTDPVGFKVVGHPCR